MITVEYFAIRHAGTEDEDWTLITSKTERVEFYGEWALFEVAGKKVAVKCQELSIIYEDHNSTR